MPQAQRSTETPREAASLAIASCAASRDTLKEPPTKEFDAHVAEDDVGVRHCRLGSAALIGRRSWLRARRARTDIEQAERVFRGDGAAAGADLDHPDRLDLEREAGALPEALMMSDLEIRAYARLAVRNQAQLCGRAAHIERQDALFAGDAAKLGRRNGTGRRAELDQADR